MNVNVISVLCINRVCGGGEGDVPSSSNGIFFSAAGINEPTPVREYSEAMPFSREGEADFHWVDINMSVPG